MRDGEETVESETDIEDLREKRLEEIVEKKVEQKTQKLQKQNQKLSEKVEKLETKNQQPTKNNTQTPGNKGISRRDFLKKAGLGTAGLATLMTPASALNINADSFSVNTGPNPNELTERINIDNGDLNLGVDTSLDANSNNVTNVAELVANHIKAQDKLELPTQKAENDNQIWVDENQKSLKVKIQGQIFQAQIRGVLDFVVYGGENNFQTHDAEDWSFNQELTESSDRFWHIAFSDDSSLVAYGDESAGEVYVHSVDGQDIWQLEETITGFNSNNGNPAVSFSQRRLAIGDNDQVVIYDTSDWTEIEILSEQEQQANVVEFSNDGSLIVYGTNDEKVYVHNTNNWSLEQTLTNPSDSITDVSFDGDNDLLAVSARDNVVHVFNTIDWSLEAELTDSTEHANSVDFSPDGSYIVVGDNYGETRVYETDNWSIVQLLGDIEGVDIEGRIRKSRFSPDGKYLAHGGDDATLWIHNVNDWSLDESLESVSDNIYAIAFDPL